MFNRKDTVIRLTLFQTDFFDLFKGRRRKGGWGLAHDTKIFLKSLLFTIKS